MALGIDPNNAVVWRCRGETLIKLEQYEGALASCDKAIALWPDDYNTWNCRGVTLYNLNRSDEAVESFDKALGMNPYYSDAKSNRESALARMKVPNIDSA